MCRAGRHEAAEVPHKVVCRLERDGALAQRVVGVGHHQRVAVVAQMVGPALQATKQVVRRL
eukprot:6046751-Pyramimonas_sp.AAC.1